MPRKLLLFAVIAVVGSMLALWLLTRGKSSESSASTQPAETTTVAQQGESTERDLRRPELPAGAQPGDPPIAQPERDPSRNPRNVDPSRPHATTVESMDRGSNPKPLEPAHEYTLPDGRKVRDFRKPENRVPLDVPPSTQAPGGRRIKPELTGLFTEQITAHMRECGKEVPASARGTKPRLEGQIIIAIKDGQASVTSAVFKLTNMTSPAAADTAKTCVERQALTVIVPATDEPDLDSYSINLSFAFP
jgi:hypothetical protein